MMADAKCFGPDGYLYIGVWRGGRKRIESRL